MDEAQLNPPATMRGSSLGLFALALGLLILLRLLIGFVAIPESLVGTASIAVSILFIALPVLGSYAGGGFPWTWKTAALMVVVGAAMQVGFLMLPLQGAPPLVMGLALAISQTGLLVWCFGLGATLAGLLKDKNLLLPVAIFLALFDIWLVFAPGGVAKKATSNVPNATSDILHKIALQVPQPVSHSSGGFAQPLAYIGPADLLFIAMFFVALFKFGMRTRETLNWLIPTLVGYLLLVLLFPTVHFGPFSLGALPALLPIGAVVLLVNRKEFKLSKDEKASTLVILIGGIAVLTWIFAHLPAPPTEPLPSGPAPRPQGSASSPLPEPKDRSRSQSRTPQENSPNPR